MDPERRVEIAHKIVKAAGDYGIPPEDIVIDALAMPIGAEPRAAALFFETPRCSASELGVNTTCGASNTSFGMPGRHALNAALHRHRLHARADQRDHGRALAGVHRRRPRGRRAARARRVRHGLDQGVPRRQAAAAAMAGS